MRAPPRSEPRNAPPVSADRHRTSGASRSYEPIFPFPLPPPPPPPPPIFFGEVETYHKRSKASKKSGTPDSGRRRRSPIGAQRSAAHGEARRRPATEDKYYGTAEGHPRVDVADFYDSWDEGVEEEDVRYKASSGVKHHDRGHYGEKKNGKRRTEGERRYEDTLPPRKNHSSDEESEALRRARDAGFMPPSREDRSVEEELRTWRRSQKEEERRAEVRKPEGKSSRKPAGLFNLPKRAAPPLRHFRAEPEPKASSSHKEKVPRSSTMPTPRSDSRHSSKKRSDTYAYFRPSSGRHDLGRGRGEIIEVETVVESDDSDDEPAGSATYTHGKRQDPFLRSDLPYRGKPSTASTNEDKKMRARERLIEKCKKEVEDMLPVSIKYKWITNTFENKRDGFDGIDKNGDDFESEVKGKRDDFLRAYKQRLLGERSKWKDGKDPEKFNEIERLRQGLAKREEQSLPK